MSITEEQYKVKNGKFFQFSKIKGLVGGNVFKSF